MSDLTKINSTHLSRLAYVYLRQSSPAQVAHNRESTARQYALVAKAADLGWPAQQVLVIDEDLGVSGSGIVERSGFARLTAEVALGHVGIVLGLEVSRLARNNADWYRLLDLCGLTDTLIGDADGIYHPAMFNDRLVLGLKGTMSEAELHILRARLLGGFIDWATYEANRSRIAANTHPQPHHSGGAVREGSALLQGLASCGACGRRLRTHYTGRTASPGYHCAGKNIVDGRGIFCLSVGAVQIDGAVARAVLAALAPAGLEAALAAAERLEADREDALTQWQLAAERARYEAQRAERRYRAVDAENRLVARGLESEWEQRLRELEQAKAELARRERERPRVLSAVDRRRLLALGADLQTVWEAPTTTARDRKELLRTLLEEVIVTVFKAEQRARLTLRWRGGSLTDIDLDLPRQKPAIVRTNEDTIALVRRLAAHYPDTVIAGILNRQDRQTAYGHRFTANHVGSLRRQWNIPRFKPPPVIPEGELLTIKQAAAVLGIATSTVHRWLNDGFIGGEQLTPAAPWRIRLTEDLRARFVDEEPQGSLTMYQAMRLLGVSRQTVLQRVKRGELEVIHVKRGKKKGLRIKAIPAQPTLFDLTS